MNFLGKVSTQGKPAKVGFKELNAQNKYRLRRGLVLKNWDGLPIVKQKVKKRVSFTEELRNKKGYDQHLANMPIGI